MSFRIKLLIVNGILILGLHPACSQGIVPITSAEMKEHVGYLASQDLGGRYPGTEGDRAAAVYIRDRFRDYGLELFNESGLQVFNVRTGVRRGQSNSLVINNQIGVPDQDFMPVSISGNGKVSGELVFVGYGFSMHTDTIDWDDYSGVDVHGRIALILLGAPEPPGNASVDPYEQNGSLRAKILAARDHGASAVILVAGTKYDEKDELEFGPVNESPAGLPVIRAKRGFINRALSTTGRSVEELESAVDRDLVSKSCALETEVELSTEVISELSGTANVIAWIPAADTGARHEWVVVGAHFDHLGLGGTGSSSRVQDTIGIHPGADDNASGTAAIVEIAGWLAGRDLRLSRSVLFVAFSAEEMGLLGSKYFVENSPVSPGRISAMINLDMVGRLSEDGRLSVSGTGTAVEMDSLLGSVEKGPLHYALSEEGYGPSDHAAFYSAGIPVLYFSTGAHLDYHTPADTPDKINYEGMVRIAGQVSDVIESIANAPAHLSFLEAGPRVSDSGRRKLKVTFGIMPDVSGTGNNGLRVEFVTPGKPAHTAGMKKGDRIIGINGMTVTNVHDYMSRLQQLKSGQTVMVELVRNGKNEVLLLQL